MSSFSLEKSFKLEAPTLGNTFLEDQALLEILDRYIFSLDKKNNTIRDDIMKDLTAFGDKVSSTIWKWSDLAERNEPKLIHYDAWHNRVDRIEMHSSWKELYDTSAREGLIALGYERDRFRQFARVYQFAKLYLYDPSCAVQTCPLSMGDGASKLLETKREQLMIECRQHLTSRDPEQFWTSNQWMTEKSGGSDVSGCETIATQVKDFDYLLNGFKWFGSSDSAMALLLAKIKDEKTGKVDDKVSLFLLKTKDETGQNWNGLLFHKFKNKLGTKAMPTSEIELKNAKATLISPRGQGVKFIATMINVTRIYNSICAVAKMRRAVNIAQDFASKRIVNKGQILAHNTLHLRWLSKMVAETTGSLHFVMDCVRILGKEECGIANQNERQILRLCIPIIKLYTGKKSLQVVSEGLEMLGGVGYTEDSGMPRLLRDAQVLSIWEGTTNILSLDVLRVLLHPESGQDTLKSWVDRAVSVANSPSSSNVSHISKGITKAVHDVVDYLKTNQKNQAVLTTFARDLAFTIAHIQVAVLLLEHCMSKNSNRNVSILKIFVEDHPLNLLPSKEKIELIKQINATDYLIGNESDGYKTPAEKRSKL
ncbi:predicted protein [Naegleria gruberi]|uniref:Predicted protein n=1 Tax=Naegleria gruberi TaxID=5762 RepID=D2VAR3_NAEGR|nr:uncharacterized protein NAEGRDRAFT_32635 [Naegleria gruberi]EFC46123.1 predicted protein [Naegleria gruberi]|eukprot:XP_002678867.1 predicted protein [Naegleria gruberi strain NEG-M]